MRTEHDLGAGVVVTLAPSADGVDLTLAVDHVLVPTATATAPMLSPRECRDLALWLLQAANDSETAAADRA